MRRITLLLYINQAYGHSACTKVEIKDEVDSGEYVANEPLYTSSPSSTISGIEGSGAYLETISGRSPPLKGSRCYQWIKLTLALYMHVFLVSNDYVNIGPHPQPDETPIDLRDIMYGTGPVRIW